MACCSVDCWPSRVNVKRRCAESSPSTETLTAAVGVMAAACTMSLSGRMYPVRQSEVCSIRAARSGSIRRTESAKIARPVPVVLRRPSPPSGNDTPALSGRAESLTLGE